VSANQDLRSRSPDETESTGAALAVQLRGGDIVLMMGDLAAGKTTFVRGMVAGLGGDPETVSSPSFVLSQTYDCNIRDVTALHHIDLYRLAENVADLREIGLDELLSDSTAVIAVEWPKDLLATWIPPDARTWSISITTEDDNSRRIEIIPPR
jgi:tRNA threonylcarbamoyladenosine biosynthesis protein TsaE